MKDLSSLEAGRWLDGAPQPVQDVVTSPTTQAILEQIGKQFSLHIDVLDLLVKLTSYMLVGYARPDESLKELKAAGISDGQARQIIDEINKKIFIPLREKMQKGIQSARSPKSSTPLQKPPAPKPTFAQVPSYAPPKPLPIQNKPVSASPAPIFEKIPTPPALSVRPPQQFQPPHPQNPTIPSRPAMVAAPKSVAPDRILEDHEEPHIEFSKQPAPARPVQVAAPAAGMPARTAPPPPNLPGAMQQPQRPGVIPPGGRPAFVMPHMSDAPARPAPTPRPIPTPTPPQKIPVPPAPKSYGADPYREPIDGN